MYNGYGTNKHSSAYKSIEIHTKQGTILFTYHLDCIVVANVLMSMRFMCFFFYSLAKLQYTKCLIQRKITELLMI